MPLEILALLAEKETRNANAAGHRPTFQLTVTLLLLPESGARGKLFHVEQFGSNGKALENFVASGFVLFGMQLRGIMPFCALLQRMGIFGVQREKLSQIAIENRGEAALYA